MLNRLQPLEKGQLATLHNACMKILSIVGVVFHEAEALEIFKKHGFTVDGKKVFFAEDKVLKALETVPPEFTIQARNPEKSVTIGGDHFALGPGWGTPLIIDANGERRNASMEDQDNFCKLVQTSHYLDLVAGSMVIPADLSTGLLAGVHFVHQACGILGAYSTISFEKFVLDEEACELMKRALCPVDISEESIGLDLIERVGNSGNYMMTDETVMGCRTAFFPSCLAQRGTYEEWYKNDMGNTARIAAKHVEERLEAYVKPDNDPTMEKDLKKYVIARLKG